MNRIKVSKNFSLHEFECKDGSHQVRVDSNLVDKLQKLRDRIGKPLIINSAYRNPTHNKKVGGAAKSQHLYGTAADVSIRNLGMTADEVAKIAREIGFTGIGLYNTFVHVDVRPTPTTWDDRKK